MAVQCNERLVRHIVRAVIIILMIVMVVALINKAKHDDGARPPGYNNTNGSLRSTTPST